jgi:hypothetical protein
MGAGDWIAVDMTVYQVNSLFAMEFTTFQNEETNHTVDQTLSYSISNTLKSGMKVIYPTAMFLFSASSSIKLLAQYLSGFPVGVMNRLDSVVNAMTTQSGRSPAATSILPDCQVSWTPARVQQLYNISSTPEPAQPAPNILAVSTFENEFSNKHNLEVGYLPCFII